jgi:glycosyltransferase involved in cell wall biosynthesis
MNEAKHTRLPLSVCMVSGAEASRIGRTLESVAPFASEIIVVLNHDVADGTEQIALKFGAKVFREPWKGFIAQKNSAADKATQPWLLNLDADEVVTAALAQEMVKVVLASAVPHAAYEFPRCSWYCGRWIRHGDWYPDRVVRLWKRGAARWMGEDPHARLQVEGSTGRLRADLLHYTSERLDHLLKKTNSYADDFVRQCEREGRQVGWIDLLVRPAWRFTRGYVIRLGFLDGWQGLSVAWMGSLYTFLRYAKVLESRQQKQEPQ